MEHLEANRDIRSAHEHGNALPGVDATIKEQLLWALISDSRLDASHVNVTVEGGVAVLTGLVTDGAAKCAAGELAWDTPRVEDVDNRLAVLDIGRG